MSFEFQVWTLFHNPFHKPLKVFVEGSDVTKEYLRDLNSGEWNGLENQSNYQES